MTRRPFAILALGGIAAAIAIPALASPAWWAGRECVWVGDEQRAVVMVQDHTGNIETTDPEAGSSLPWLEVPIYETITITFDDGTQPETARLGTVEHNCPLRDGETTTAAVVVDQSTTSLDEHGAPVTYPPTTTSSYVADRRIRRYTCAPGPCIWTPREPRP